MKQEIGLHHLLEGRAEGVHEAVGQLLDEAHGVDQQDVARRTQAGPAHQGVEGHEELVGGTAPPPG